MSTSRINSRITSRGVSGCRRSGSSSTARQRCAGSCWRSRSSGESVSNTCYRACLACLASLSSIGINYCSSSSSSSGLSGSFSSRSLDLSQPLRLPLSLSGRISCRNRRPYNVASHQLTGGLPVRAKRPVQQERRAHRPLAAPPAARGGDGGPDVLEVEIRVPDGDAQDVGHDLLAHQAREDEQHPRQVWSVESQQAQQAAGAGKSNIHKRGKGRG